MAACWLQTAGHGPAAGDWGATGHGADAAQQPMGCLQPVRCGRNHSGQHSGGACWRRPTSLHRASRAASPPGASRPISLWAMHRNTPLRLGMAPPSGEAHQRSQSLNCHSCAADAMSVSDASERCARRRSNTFQASPREGGEKKKANRWTRVGAAAVGGSGDVDRSYSDAQIPGSLKQ